MISIVLPIHNQQDHIAFIAKEYSECLGALKRDYEIIFVTNNCRDDSELVCRNLEIKNPCIKTINSTKGGWGLAVKLGISSSRGDLICYTNSARTTGQELSILLYYAVVFPEVVVKANRKIRDNFTRRAGSFFYNLECRTLFDLSNWDINGTPKIFPRSFSSLLKLKKEDDLIDLEFCVSCRKNGYPMIEVPIFSTRRHGGKSTTNFSSALRMYLGCINLYRNLKLTS